LTSVAKDRLPVFRTDEIKNISAKALDEARLSGKFALYAYVIMPDHLYVITDSSRSSADTLRFVNGITGYRVIAYLKERGYETSLQKLRQETKRRQYRHSLWDHHPNVRLLLTENMLLERVRYLHENPVRAGLVECAADCRYSSARCWSGKLLEDEPILMDLDRIKCEAVEGEPRFNFLEIAGKAEPYRTVRRRSRKRWTFNPCRSSRGTETALPSSRLCPSPEKTRKRCPGGFATQPRRVLHAVRRTHITRKSVASIATDHSARSVCK